jgi:4-hydroxybenzoyl-CoA thioesterase
MIFERTKLIRFHHCDPAGIVFYPQYLVLCNELVEDWFDEGMGVNFFTLHTELKRGVPMRHLETDFRSWWPPAASGARAGAFFMTTTTWPD